jgi:polysaccharide export outer membrane protein
MSEVFMKRIVFGLFMFAAAVTAYAQSGQTRDKPADTLGVGDAVQVSVFQHADLATSARITERGTITMPLIGEVKLAGLSTTEAGTHIAHALKSGQFLKNPQVSVAVTTVRSRQVNVLGMVLRAGRYPLDDTSSNLSDVIAAAGGIAPGGSEIVTLVRNGQAQKVDLMTKAFELKNGDTIQVERAPVFYIYGEVLRAGAYRIEPNMTVMQAIAAGGGITPRGSESRLILRRPAADGKFVENYVGLLEPVKTDDVIYVREALF